MSTTQRVVRKQLAGAEDLLQGIGIVTQARGSGSYPIHKLDIPIPTYDIAEMQASSAEFMRLYGSDTVYTDYRRNPEGTIGIPSNLGGVWEPMRFSEYLVCGNFATGAYVFSSDCIVALDQQLYSWSGAFPKVVYAGSTPATSGGVGAGAWVYRTDNRLRSDLSGGDGSLVGIKLSKVGSALRNLNDFIGDSLPTPEMFNNGIKYANYKSGSNWYEDSAFTIPATDCTPVIQAALNVCGGVKLSSGRNYYLATPLQVTSNTAIISDIGRLSGWYQSGALSSLRPATCAIKTSDYNDQKMGFTLKNVGIVGGTTQVDLGLFHEVEVSGCEFKDATGTNLVLVRGEKHLITRNRFDAADVNTYCAMSIGRWQESLNSANYSDAYFGAAGAFFDRGTISSNVMQAGPSGVFSYGILSNILSGTVLSDLTFHGNSNAGGEVAVIWVRDRIQQCQISVIAPDAIGSDSNKLNSLFYAAQVLNSTFINVSPQFSGTCKYVKGFDIPYAVNSVFIGCRADGDNVSQFGFSFGTSVGSTCSLVNCSGAFHHSSTNQLIRGQIAQVNCDFSQANNGTASGQVNIRNQDMLALLMADINGATANTAKWGAVFATGSGGKATPFYAKKEGAWIDLGSRLYLANTFGETYPQSISVSSVIPEGNVQAYPGAICLYYSGIASGKLYVKETGTGNTGWVLK